MVNAVKELAQPAPACSVYSSAAQDIPANTATKIQFDTAEFDVTSAFDLDNNRFQPTVDGYFGEVIRGQGRGPDRCRTTLRSTRTASSTAQHQQRSVGGNIATIDALAPPLHDRLGVEGFVHINKSFNTYSRRRFDIVQLCSGAAVA